jgi:ABC-type nitrate/sulfonate/bicarbonate transport system permease component
MSTQSGPATPILRGRLGVAQDFRRRRRQAPTPGSDGSPAKKYWNAEKSTGALAILGGAVVWQLVALALDLNWFPPFTKVLAALEQLIRNGEIFTNLAISIRILAIGFAISLSAGLLLGVLMGRYRRVEQALGIYVNAMLATPGLIFAPIYFSLWHDSDWVPIAVVIQYSVFFIIINTSSAVQSVDRRLVEMATSFNAKERQIVTKVLVPGAMVLGMAGVRVGLGRAVKGMVTGQMYATVFGLGGVVQRYGGQFDASSVLAISLVILIFALTLGALVRKLDRRLTRWVD